MAGDNPLYDRVYLVVSQVPPGQVTTYGDVARLVGGGCDARIVGYAMADLGKYPTRLPVPWQRVINAQGGISTRGPRQRQLLEAEGVTFNEKGRVDLARCRWRGPDPAFVAEHGLHPLDPPDDAPPEQGRLL